MDLKELPQVHPIQVDGEADGAQRGIVPSPYILDRKSRTGCRLNAFGVLLWARSKVATLRLPGAPPPLAGGKSLILNHSSAPINPGCALCSSLVHSDPKSSRPKRFSAS